MNENRRYLSVGLFVIFATLFAVTVWLWFSASSRQNYNTFVAIFTEPVDGVTTNSIVKYNGVEVGKVKKIELDKENQRNIIIYLNILEHVAINEKTYASIKAQGITGLSFINLTLPKDAILGRNIKPHNSKPYPIIPTQPSLLYGFVEQARVIGGNIDEITNHVKLLLNEKNLDHISKLLDNLDKISTAIASRSDSITKSVDLMGEVLINVKENTENLNLTFKEIRNLTQTLSQTTQSANQLIGSLETNTIPNLNTVLLPTLNNTINHLNKSTYHLEQLLILLNQNPSALVRGKLPAKPGPGE